ncbi:MAG: cytochrome c [Byssovorax sp.]
MNRKLWTAASATLSLLILAGCATPPPSTININTQSGSGGSGAGPGAGGSETSAETSVGVGGAGGGMVGGQAKAYYIANIDSQLNATCASCHASGQNGAPIFMGMNPEASYNALDQHGGLVVAPENSLMLLHGAHTGPALTAAEKTDVTTWLTMEANERGLSTGGGMGGADGGAPSAITLKQALDEYGACMDITDWTDNKLDTLYNAQTLNYGPCGGCHGNGDGGNWLSSNKQETFDMNKKFPYIKRQITGTVDADGNFKDLIASNRWIQKGSEPCQPNTNCHPAYVLPPTLKTGVETFVSKTLDKWHNKTCTPSP